MSSLAIACAGHGVAPPALRTAALDEPPGDVDPGELAEREADLAAARAAVVSSPEAIAGALPGQMSVGPAGQLSYEVPIEVPPGRSGMAPALSVVYSSTTGNGPLGVSWSLTGFSEVARCRRTVHLDGEADGVDHDATDRFCLDGQRLDPVAGSGTEFRTRQDSYARITGATPTTPRASASRAPA